jgi:hypothetical protein
LKPATSRHFNGRIRGIRLKKRPFEVVLGDELNIAIADELEEIHGVE